jgi:NitT/TauT family transport system substrate-binding protein
MMGAIGMLGAGLALASCGGNSPVVTTGDGNTSGSACDPITFSLDFSYDGLHAPFLVAEAKDYYDEVGLDMTFRPGQGSADVINRVANGVVPMGLASATSVLIGASGEHKGTLKVVGLMVPSTPAAVESLKGSNIEEPSDLIGKTVGQAPSTSVGLFGALLEKTGINPDEINMVSVQPSSMKPTLLGGKVDAVTLYGQVFADKQDKVDFIFYKDYGIAPYSSSIVVDSSYLEENPSCVESFTEATMRGLKYSAEHPEEAGQIVADVAGTGEEFYKAEVEFLNTFWTGEEIRDTGYGVMTEEGWKSTQEFNLEYGDQDEALTSEELAGLWTNEYLGEVQH